MKFRSRFILINCLWVAFFLRIWGLDFGLPYDIHPDEHQYVETALNWYTSGEMEARFINPPLFTYVLAVVLQFWFTFSPFEPSLELLTNTYVFARLWSVIFSLFTIVLMYPLGKCLYNQKAGLLGVVFMSALFLPAREAHFAVNDAIVTFFALLAIYFSLKVFKQGNIKFYVGAGIAIGLATGAKYLAVLLVLPLLFAHGVVIVNSPRFSRREVFNLKAHTNLWLGLLTALVTFLIVTVQIILQLPQFIQRFSELAEFGAQGFAGTRMGPATGWQFYIDSLGWGIGWVMVGAVLIALVYGFVRRQRGMILVSLFSIALFVFMGAQKAFSARYLLPAVPPLVALVAVFLARLEPHRLFFRKYQPVFWVLILVTLLAQPLINLVWFDYLLTLPDTQQLATNWFVENFDKDTVIVKEPYSILPDFIFLTKNWPYKTTILDKSDPARSDENYYASHKTQIIAVSNFMFGRIRQDPTAEELRLKQLALLDEKAILIKEFNPYRRSDYDDWFYLDQLYGPAGETLQRVAPGPLIKIYRLPYQNQPYSLEMPPISDPVNANFADKLILLGYDLPSHRSDPGGSFPLTLYWQAADRMDETYVIFNHLLDAQQQNWGGYDRWPQETSNTNLWHPGEVVIDTFSLPIAADAPAGIYTIDIGLYNQSDLLATALSLVRDGHSVDQNSIRIGPVKVGQAPSGVTLSPLETHMPAGILTTNLGDPPLIALHGYNLLRKEDELHLKLYWESLSQTSTDWSIFTHIRNKMGETIAQKDGLAGGSSSIQYPTSLWEPGELIVDEFKISLPSNLLAGDYTIVTGLYNLVDGVRLSVPGSMNNEINLVTFEILDK